MPTPQNRKFLLRKDFIIIAALLVAAALFYLVNVFLSGSTTTAVADIYLDSKIVKTVQLKAGLNDRFTVPGQPDVTIEVTGNKIHFVDSTCRDKICIHAGFLSRPGEMAACLPNKVAIKIVDSGTGTSGQPDTYAN